jgi:hypothetical protein
LHLTDQKPTASGRYWWAPPDDPEGAILVRVQAHKTWCPAGEVLVVQAMEDPPEPWSLPRKAWMPVVAIDGLWSSEPLPGPPAEVRTSALPT